MEEILSQLQEVFRDTFQRDDICLSRDTAAGDVPNWDSLMHVTLVKNVERAFRIRFRLAEVAAMRNVGQLVDLIAARRG